MNKANYHHELTLKKSTSSQCKSENITENIEKLAAHLPEQVAGPAKFVVQVM